MSSMGVATLTNLGGPRCMREFVGLYAEVHAACGPCAAPPSLFRRLHSRCVGESTVPIVDSRTLLPGGVLLWCPKDSAPIDRHQHILLRKPTRAETEPKPLLTNVYPGLVGQATIAAQLLQHAIQTFGWQFGCELKTPCDTDRIPASWASCSRTRS